MLELLSQSLVAKLKRGPTPSERHFNQQGVELETKSPSLLLEAPNEVITNVFGFLGCIELLQCSYTCSKLYHLSSFMGLWKDLYLSSFKVPSTSNKDHDKLESNWKNGKCKQKVLLGHSEPVWGVQFHKSHLVSGSEGGELRVWNLDTGKFLYPLRGHTDFVNTFHFSGDYVASGGDDFNVKLWDVFSGRCLHTFTGHELPVWMVEFAENTLVSGSCDKTLRLWDMNTGQSMQRLVGHTGRIYYLQVKDNLLVSGSQDKTCRVWDIRIGKCVQDFMGDSAVHCLQVNPDQSIVSGHGNGNVFVWSVQTGSMCSKLTTGLHPVAHLQSNGSQIITSSREKLFVWDMYTSLNTPKIFKGHTDDIKFFQLRGDRLASGGFDTTIKVWQLSDDDDDRHCEAKPTATLEGHRGRIDWLEFKSEKMVSCSSDCTIRVWDFS